MSFNSSDSITTKVTNDCDTDKYHFILKNACTCTMKQKFCRHDINSETLKISNVVAQFHFKHVTALPQYELKQVQARHWLLDSWRTHCIYSVHIWRDAWTTDCHKHGHLYRFNCLLKGKTNHRGKSECVARIPISSTNIIHS